MSDGDDDDTWSDLHQWMEKHHGFESKVEMRNVTGAGRGLFTQSDVMDGESLLHIPSSAMLNPLTLSHSAQNTIPLHLFPCSYRVSPMNKAKRVKPSTAATNGNTTVDRRLDTTQLLTLHLLLSRDPQGRHPSEWSSYIATLPKTFRPWHPLTWLVPNPSKTRVGSKAKRNGHKGEDDNGWWDSLAHNGLSSSALSKVEEVKKRFLTDYDILVNVLREEEPFASEGLAKSLTMDDHLWAWLNVNTRSVSLPLGLPPPSQRNDHTLVPMLDYINHSSSPKQITSHVKQVSNIKSTTRGGGAGNHFIPGKIDFAFTAKKKIQKGKEVSFQYGNHCSATLFAEYGFVEVPPGVEEEKWLQLEHGEIDFGYLVDDFWGKTEKGDEKKEVLEALGSWRRNTIHAKPQPQPAHSLLMTLRLLHLTPGDTRRLGSIRQGLVTYISASNESAVMETLAGFCEKAIQAAQERSDWLKGLEPMSDDDERNAVRTLLAMCEEERVLADAVLKRIEEGDDLS